LRADHFRCNKSSGTAVPPLPDGMVQETCIHVDIHTRVLAHVKSLVYKFTFDIFMVLHIASESRGRI
ncbi:MAG: hypothetical protein ACKPKO_50770, partial [Candidatus Fonsibacter sp.]